MLPSAESLPSLQRATSPPPLHIQLCFALLSRPDFWVDFVLHLQTYNLDNVHAFCFFLQVRREWIMMPWYGGQLSPGSERRTRYGHSPWQLWPWWRWRPPPQPKVSKLETAPQVWMPRGLTPKILWESAKNGAGFIKEMERNCGWTGSHTKGVDVDAPPAHPQISVMLLDSSKTFLFFYSNVSRTKRVGKCPTIPIPEAVTLVNVNLALFTLLFLCHCCVCASEGGGWYPCVRFLNRTMWEHIKNTHVRFGNVPKFLGWVDCVWKEKQDLSFKVRESTAERMWEPWICQLIRLICPPVYISHGFLQLTRPPTNPDADTWFGHVGPHPTTRS